LLCPQTVFQQPVQPSERVYNCAVAAPIHPGSARRIYGLIVVALLILAITIARFCRHIPWSAR
jgi:hypothetical protein